MTFHDPLMTKSDVAALLRCCERTVERQVKLQAFPPPQRFGKEALWFQSIVFGWLEHRRTLQQQWVAAQTQEPESSSALSVATPAPPAEATVVKAKPTSRARSWEGAHAAQPMFKPT